MVREPNRIVLTIEDPTGTHDLEAERLFLTVGKRPDTANLGLPSNGSRRPDSSPWMIGNGRTSRTCTAAGDVARPPMLAHKAYREGVVAAETIAGLPTRFQFQTIPSVVFTDPELASVGLTVGEATAQGHKARDARFPFAALDRAHAAHATPGDG